MKRFLKKTIFFSGLFILSFMIFVGIDIFYSGNQYLNNYQASVIDKIQRLESIKEPKIILVGNSNVAFGINSKMIEDALGMPVVNLGLHGAMGNTFHENMIKGNVNPGDIVVICHSDFGDDGTLGDPGLAWITIEKHKELYYLISPQDYPSMLKAYPRYAMKCLGMKIKHSGNGIAGGSYSRQAFNEYGDIVLKPNVDYQSTLDEFKSGVNPPEISDACVKRLNKLNEYVESCGGQMVIAGYPIGEGEYTVGKEDFIEFQKRLEDKMDCDVISDYTDYFIPYKYFYNSKMHLTEEGTEIRTNQLILDLKRRGIE